MKALILAAGFGTRLRPHTDRLPKPLFPIGGRPLLDRLVRRLLSAGCTAIAVNTHHLHHQIEVYLSGRSYADSVFTRYEPDILGTGGAIRNLSDFWDERPFLVVNSDILTDINFGAVYEFHCRQNAPATLVLVDAPPLNSVTVDSDGNITGFLSREPASPPGGGAYTFTGIQVLEPRILPLIPENAFYSSIDVYRALIARGTPPRAYRPRSCHWVDIGTPERFGTAARDILAPGAFQNAFGRRPAGGITSTRLSGDGSDRAWYRLTCAEGSLVAADHGIRPGPGPGDIDSMVAIGRHLHARKLPVPKIYHHDLFSGWVFMEDAGDTHLQTVIRRETDPGAIRARYREVIDVLVRFSVLGIQDFDPAWTNQSAAYDRPLIMERECAYFVNAFLRGYLGLEVSPGVLTSAFEKLTDGALTGAVTGLMHRDFQSRNILIYRDAPRIIDFQGARRGPIQYDLASLLIDPYVALPVSLQDELLGDAMARLSQTLTIRPGPFRRCYEFCRITRNLQALGAFGHLSREKGKRHFEQFIPTAMQSLKRNLAQINLPEVSALRKLVEEIHI